MRELRNRDAGRTALAVYPGADQPRRDVVLSKGLTGVCVGMIAGQIGTAFAVHTQRASLRSVGVFTSRYLLGGIATEVLLAALFVDTGRMPT